MYGYNVFHKKLMMTLIESVRRNENANTYIFEGAEGLKKHEAALLFAKSLVCTSTDSQTQYEYIKVSFHETLLE
mgnify:CR=1 FL=1